jgi:hypothetical protein
MDRLVDDVLAYSRGDILPFMDLSLFLSQVLLEA